MSEVEAAGASMLGFMASWFTPTVLFCVLNLMIGTIFITSNFKSQTKQQQHGEDNLHQLVRTPSLLERVRSIDWSVYRSDQPHPFLPEAHYDHPLHHQTQLVRAPSLLERVMSSNFSPYRSEQHDPFPAETYHTDLLNHQTQLVRSPSLLQRVMSINFSPYRSEQNDPFPPETHHMDVLNHQTQEVQAQLVRSPSLLERVMSNFSRHRSEQPDTFPPETHHTDALHHQTQKSTQGVDHDHDNDQDHHVTRSKSDTHGEAPKRFPEKMKKSASQKMGVDRTEEEVEDERVDERADDFIKRFRQHLKLQRLDSLLRYNEMLNRGTAK